MVWRCIECAHSNADDAAGCGKCGAKRPAQDPDETALQALVDPDRPVAISDSSTVQCPTCGETFKVQSKAGSSSRLYRRVDAALCPSCARAITPEALLRISPKPRDTGTPVREVLLACPYCGKVLGIGAP